VASSSSSLAVPSSPALTTAPVTHTPTPTHRATTRAAPKKSQAAHTSASSKPKAGRLPLDFSTVNATQVITVVASSTSSTQGTLQTWRKTGGGWLKVGDSVHAYLGSDGLTKHPSESRSATPIGSFTLTQAFGRDADPGTSLPYTKTTPDDWWISQPGQLYNTRQRCSSGCDFTRGDPNEHLYYETPYYRYAVVIDYNTTNAPGGVRAGAGSAFFLHVTVGAPTAGCVSINEDQLVRILRWLAPSRHPRIMIGTG
jgi:L,D-peptidoglycan transpeptidase YkuD (ErfK/YbiS/YcfS/YnhG family)